MGGGIAWLEGGFVAGPFLAALAGGLLIQSGTNFANDYSDFVRGADTGERLGSRRATQSGLLTAAQVRAGAAASFGLALLVGSYLVLRGGWPVVAIGVAAIAAGIAYTGGPWPFGYHGLGDAFVFIFFGPVAVAGTAYVQTLDWTSEAILAGAGAGAVVTAILVVNNLRDRHTDALAGKGTLAVRIGERATRAEYAFLLSAGLLVPPLGIVIAGWPPGVLLSLAGGVAAGPPLARILRGADGRELNPALADTARAAGLYGLGFAAGCVV